MIKTKTLIAYSPIALAVLSALAHASSAVGTDNQIGNEMNPSGTPVLCAPDPKGLMAYKDDSRTPSGLLFKRPCLTPEMDETGEGWIVYGTIEGGVIGSGGDDDNAYFVEYADRDDSPTITVIDLSARDRDSARYAHVNAGNLGLDDAHLEAEFGKAGSYKARVVFNKIPHVYATNARTPYQGVGTGRLTLPPEFPPNSVSGAGAADLNDYIARQDKLTLRVDRKRTGVSLEYELLDGLQTYLDYKHEQRDGIKAYGGSFNFDFLEALGNIGSVNEVVQPIDYASDDFTAGIRYQGRGYNLGASYTGSRFRNDIDSLTYENPWRTAGVFGGSYSPVTGQTDLAPDNDFNQLRLEGNYDLPWNGVATLTLSRGRMDQDDRLLPFTTNSGVLFGGLVDLSEWNTTAGLARQRADARIDTGLEQLKVSFKPTAELGVRLGYRHYREDNHTTPFSTCNSLNGQCAFILLDGALGEAFQSPALFRLFDPANGAFQNFHYKSIPFDHEKDNLSAALSYQLTPKTRLGFDYELETIQRSYREVEQTDESRYRLNLAHRDARWGSLRVEAGLARRDYDGAYNSNPYEAFWTEQLLHELIDDPATDPAAAAAARNYLDTLLEPHTLNALRKSDLSERDQYTLALKFNVALGAKTDLMLTADYKDNEYDAAYGLAGDTTSGFGAELSHALGAASNWYLSYHLQKIESAMRNIDSTDIGSHDASPGGDYYPLANAWGSGEDELSHFVSAGFETQLGGSYRFGMNYSFGLTKTRIRYAAASQAALPASMPGAAIEGRFDDLRYQQQVVSANLRGQLSPQLSWRLYALYEAGQVADFHYQGIQYADSAKMLLGTRVGDWDAYVLGLLAQYKF